MKLEGGCYCGALRYRTSAEVKIRSQCHCRPCQYFSGGGPNYFMLVPPEGFDYIHGLPKSFTRSEIENAVTRDFCPECGTHIATRRPGLDMIILKAGTLDNPSAYEKPGSAIFTCDAQPFHHIPDDIPTFEHLPKRK